MAASRSPSPMASPGPELLLSPRSRMEARLAAMDSSSEDEDSHSAPRQARKASGEQTPTRRSPAAIPTQDSEDDSEDDIRPRGRLAARMHDMATKATSQDASMADADEEEDDEDIIAAPRRLKRRDADGATTPREQSPAASSSPGLFVSRHQTPAPAEQANASDSDNSLPDMKSSRFAALVKRKREERLAREAEEERKREERMARQVGLDTLDDSDGNVSSITDDEGGRQLSQKVRPTRKAGKKAIEEMNRETQRMARNMQLAHEAKTRKKITKASLFERFNFRTAPAAEPTPELKTTNSSRPTSPVSAHNSDVDMKDAETPPSSPPANAGSPTKPSTTAQPAAAAAQDDEDDLPTLEELLRGAPEKSDKAKGKEIAVDSPPKPTTKDAVPKRQFRVKMPAVSANLVSLDSDDELEIAVAKRTTRIDAVFDRVPEKKTNEAQALHALRLLAQVTSPGKESRKKSDGKLSMTSGELQLMLHQRARQQAKLERERRLEALKAKGIVVQTVEEREKEMQDVEDVVTKARKEAEEIMEREREAAKEERRTKIKNGELDPLAWDDSEDDDDYEGSDEGQGDEKDVELELSGSEDEDAMADSDAEDGNPLVDNEADEDEDETVAATNQDVADSDEEASLPTRNVRRSKKNAHVISDDEDEDEVVEATPKPKMTSLVSPVVPTTKSPAVPTSVLRSAKKSFIPGLPITGPAGLGLTQIFAGTMDDSQDMPESATMASPMPSFGGFPNFDEETQPGDEMILDSQAADTQKAPTQQDVETQGIQLHYTQSQMHGFNSLLRDDNLNSTQVDFEPSQDGGLQEYTPLRERFFDAPSTAQTHPLDRDVDGESVQDSPLVRRGRLRRKIESIAEEPESTFASKVGLLNGAEAGASATAFETMKAAAKKEKKIKEYNKKKSKAKDMFEEQADESEDEYAGLGGADGEDSSDDDDAASVKEMIDDEAGKDGDERKNAALYAERERARDEQQVDKLFHDLTTGMLRRKRGADYDLSDSDDGGEARRRLKRRQFAKMQKALFTDERIKKIAENPGNQAFMRTIEDRGSDEEMDFLEMGPEPAEEASQSQEQTVPDSQPAAGTTEPLGAAGASRVSANPRRTKEGRKPSNIGEIRESLSSLLEDPNDLLVTATEIGSDSEGDDERPSTSRSNKENTSPGKANPRRTAAPKHAIIDRMSLKRDSSSNLSTSSKLAFTSATSSSGFKVPALLRRATTNSLTSASTGGTSSGRSAGASSGFGDDGKIRKSAGKKSGVSYLARETERRSVIQQHDKRREARKLRGAEKRGKAVGGLFGSGQFEHAPQRDTLNRSIHFLHPNLPFDFSDDRTKRPIALQPTRSRLSPPRRSCIPHPAPATADDAVPGTMTPGPPPSTPDPRKFLLTKRNPPASQDTTPRPRQFQPSGATSSQQQRFHATPRFAPASSASTPRPPSGTQGFGFPGTARRRQEAIVDDGVESSPTGARGSAGDLIEVESDAEDNDDDDDDEDRGGEEDEHVQDSVPGSEGPTPKRRRVEVESESAASDASGRESEGEDEDNDDGMRTADDHDMHDMQEAQEEDEAMLDAPQTPTRSEPDESDHEEVPDAAGTKQQQPTFQRAPRFRASEVEAVRHEGLPEAFSPQRRGVRYIPGGLAAEMQSWLAEVKGWGGHERPAEAAVRFVVEEVEAGGMMYLVNGRRLQSETEGSASSVRLMLAGEGKLTGLAKKAEVHVGAVVMIAQPAWEVALGVQGDGEDRWVVACDWAVQAGDAGP